MLIYKVIILFLYSTSIFAIDAVVIVLETPLLSEKRRDASVLMVKRKGDLIKIRNKDISRDIYSPKYTFAKMNSYGDEDFYETMDKNGKPAYIVKEHLKLVYNDEREFDEKVSFKNDPTDYRLAEPLPEDYPLYSTERFRGSFSFSIAPGNFDKYDYEQEVSIETFSTKKGIEFQYLKNASFDQYDKIYFGLFSRFNIQNNTFSLSSGLNSDESISQIQIGPYLTYDYYKNKKIVLSMGGGIFFNYIKDTVRISSINSLDERSFKGYYFSPHVNTQFIYHYINAKDHKKVFAYFAGVDVEVNTPTNLSSSDEFLEGFESIWNDQNDQVSISLNMSYTLSFGIKTYFE